MNWGIILGLLHTHENYDKCNCEKVDGSNACLAGDRVADTPAMPNFRTEYCFFEVHNGECGYLGCRGNSTSAYYNINPENCSYIGDNEDCQGNSYQISSNDIKNYMAYSGDQCQDRFTIGQAIRMREAIAWDYQGVGTFEGTMGLAQTDVEALYQPYKGVYSLDGSYTLGPDFPPLFQPGFDYTFKQCGPPGISASRL
ncbi:MAG: hypothetical protein R2773_01880 [Flavobacteriaceae bacterium]